MRCFCCQVVIDADGVGGVLDGFRQRRVLEVAGAIGRTGRLRHAEVLQRGARHRVDHARRNDVAGERIRHDAAARGHPSRERVVDLVLRAEREQLREITGAHLRARHRGRAVVARPRLVDPLEAVHEERPPPAVVARQQHGSADAAAVAVVGEVGERKVVGVGEEIVGEQALRRLREIGRARERIAARLDAQVGHASLGVAHRRVEGGRLHLELLDDVGWRHVRRDDLSGVRRGSARHAVDGQVAAVAARAVHRVPDDVRRLEGTIEAGRAGVGDAGGQADQVVRIAVRRRQLGDAPGIDDVAERAVGGFEEGRRGADRHFLDRAANFERDLELEPIGDADVDRFTHPLLESRELDRDLVGPGNQIGNLKESIAVRHGRNVRAHRDVRRGHRGAGHQALAGVDDCSRNRASRVLRRRGERHDGEEDDGDQACNRGLCRVHGSPVPQLSMFVRHHCPPAGVPCQGRVAAA